MPPRAPRTSAVPAPASAAVSVAATKLGEQLHEWCMKVGGLGSRQPKEFLAELPRWQREARTGVAEPLAALRLLGVRVAEGTALMRMQDNDRAVRVLTAVCGDLSARLAQGVPAGTEVPLRRSLGAARLNLGNVAYHRGEFAKALPEWRAAGELMLLIGDRGAHATALSNIATIYGDVGLYDEQLRLGLQARAVELELNRPVGVALDTFNIAAAHVELGDFTAARQCCEYAERIWVREGRKSWALQARIRLSEIDVKVGRIPTALARLKRIAAECAADDNRGLEPMRLAAVALALAAGKRWREAADAFPRALEAYAAQPDLHTEGKLRIEHGRVLLQLGETERAAESARGALAKLQEMGVPASDTADAERLLSDCAQQRGDWRAAWEHEHRRREAYEAFFQRDRDRRAAVLAAQHQLDLARSEAERQRTENARLSEALAAVASRLKPDAGVGAPGPAPAAAMPEDPSSLRPLGLTKRESEVLWWVAEGKTNDEICAILATGLANVKKQLQNIYTKLGVENRTAAAGRALRHLRGT